MDPLISELPFDILVDILSRLPLKSLSRCRWVCKSWCDLIHHPLFAKVQHQRALKNTHPSVVYYQRLLFRFTDMQTSTTITSSCLEFKEFQDLSDSGVTYLMLYTVGSVNGLICYKLIFPKTYFIINPLTQQLIPLPKSPNVDDTNFTLFNVTGFGYDSVTDKYKVIRILQKYHTYTESSGGVYYLKMVLAEVCTIGSNNWRLIKTPPYTIISRKNPSSVFVNGHLHWLCYQDAKVFTTLIIAAFHVGTEEFSVFKPPHILETMCPYLGVLDNCLCYIVQTRPNFQHDLWVMTDYSNHDSWVKKYVFGRDVMGRYWSGWHGSYEIKKSNNGELLMLCNYNGLGYYNPQTRTIRPAPGIKYNFPDDTQLVVQVPSLYSPKHIGRSPQRYSKRRLERHTGWSLKQFRSRLEIWFWNLFELCSS